MQSRIFRYFLDCMEKIITDAKNNGDYNEGIVDCSGESMKLLSKEVLWRD